MKTYDGRKLIGRISERKFEILSGVTCKRLMKISPTKTDLTSFSIAHLLIKKLWVSEGLNLFEVDTASRSTKKLTTPNIGSELAPNSYISNISESSSIIYMTVNNEDYTDTYTTLYRCTVKHGHLFIHRRISCTLALNIVHGLVSSLNFRLASLYMPTQDGRLLASDDTIIKVDILYMGNAVLTDCEVVGNEYWICTCENGKIILGSLKFTSGSIDLEDQGQENLD
jgi:hypothetical protein